MLMHKKFKKPPQVKQTLTSKYRMLKANPLLMYELGKKIDSNSATKEGHMVKPLKTLAAVLDADHEIPKYNVNTFMKFSSETPNKQCKSDIVIQSGQQKYAPNELKPESLKHKTVYHFNAQRKNLNKQSGTKKLQHNEISRNYSNTLNTCGFTKRNEVEKKKFTIVTANNLSLSAGKSAAFNETINKQEGLLMSNLNSYDVAEKLSNWLKQKGKNFREYHHLKCFGIDAGDITQFVFPDAEKENFVFCNTIKNDSHGNENQKNSVEKHNLSVVAQDALLDLHKLILEGYPPAQCEIWLRLIKQKYKKVEEEPHYWECRAALEQTKGNINLAVECYKTAIVQGAEVENVDKYLDQLLHKFSLLNISTYTNSHINKEQRKVVEDARNIFKSSIIQFAVQERVFRKKSKDGVTIEKKIFATPVRRSTRQSRCAYTSTPRVNIYSSLQDIDSSLRDTLNFQCNNALKDE